MNLIDRIEELEKRLSFIEEQLGIGKNLSPITPRLKPRTENPPVRNYEEQMEEQKINGFTKDQLKIMFTWAKSLRLNQLTKGDFEELKKWEVLKDFYPDAPENYEDIKR